MGRLRHCIQIHFIINYPSFHSKPIQDMQGSEKHVNVCVLCHNGLRYTAQAIEEVDIVIDRIFGDVDSMYNC